MNKHTPGPWKLVDWSHQERTNRVFVEGPGCVTIATTKKENPQRVADARLISVAPELLEAVKKFFIRFEHEIGSTQYEEIRQLIAKAEGTNE